VADVEFGIIKEPDVGFDACTAPVQSVVQGNAAPVVVVRVARDGRDVVGDVEEGRSNVPAWVWPV
jgi:hypothetical protein